VYRVVALPEPTDRERSQIYFQRYIRHLPSAGEIEKAIVESGIILLKYWLDISPEEQARRLKARINEGRKIWKLSSMDLQSYRR